MASTNGSRFVYSVRLLTVCFLALSFLGCAQTQVKQKAGHYEPKKAVSVLLMPVDIELSALTAGGVREVRADWTKSAKRLLSQALESQLADKSDRLIEYQEPNDPQTLEQHQQIVKLHGVIGETIMVYSLLPSTVPPTKKDAFDWSMGKEVSLLREASGADYGLFVYIRDSYATAGRKALIVTSALFGVGVTGGSQVGFATLVDLGDGSVVWFNRMVRQTGDLRTRGPADETVRELIEGIPL